jgi:hypothetical protein
MDRRAVICKSKAELVVARIGEVMAACYLLLLLPVLPFLLAYVAVQKLLAAFTGRSDERRRFDPETGPPPFRFAPRRPVRESSVPNRRCLI